MRLVVGLVVLGGVMAALGAPTPKYNGPKASEYYPARKGDMRVYESRPPKLPTFRLTLLFCRSGR